MSENTAQVEAVEAEVEETETTETETERVEETTEERVPTGNAVVDGLVTLAVDKAAEANKIAETVSNAKGNLAKSIKDVRDTSEDEEIAAYREWENKVFEEVNRRREVIDAKIAASLGGNAMTDAEIEAQETNHKALARAAKDAWKAAETTAKMFGVTEEALGAAPSLKTLGGRNSSVAGPASAGGKRYRFDDVKVNGASVGSLSKAALEISQKSGVKTTAADLQSAFTESEKTDDVYKLNGTSIAYSATKDGKTHSFTVEVFKAPKSAE